MSNKVHDRKSNRRRKVLRARVSHEKISVYACVDPACENAGSYHVDYRTVIEAMALAPSVHVAADFFTPDELKEINENRYRIGLPPIQTDLPA